MRKFVPVLVLFGCLQIVSVSRAANVDLQCFADVVPYGTMMKEIQKVTIDVEMNLFYDEKVDLIRTDDIRIMYRAYRFNNIQISTTRIDLFSENMRTGEDKKPEIYGSISRTEGTFTIDQSKDGRSGVALTGKCSPRKQIF